MIQWPDNIWQRLGELFSYDPKAPLIFSSGLFLFLFAGFTLFYVMMRRQTLLRLIYVLLFSLYFYYLSSGLYFLVLLFVATTDYFIGRALGPERPQSQRKWLVALSVVINLGLLCYFKYTNFFIGIVNDVAGHDLLAFRKIFLPVGVSFFVFQSMSYTIDLYRRRIEPLQNWLDYAFYLSFFPGLVAGPIVRARDFIPQIRQAPVVVTREMFGTGMFLIISGLFKKAIISDYISLNFVDRIFDNPALYSGFENLMGVYGYAMQIYCDFSGYSDMAIGIALLLGFKFPKNFDSPYKSATITEFWRRWHISLSSWLKDYLYISLGGNRRGRVRTYINLMLTMLLGGLWHGASMKFVLWGGLHGGALAIHKAIMPSRGADGKANKRNIKGIVLVILVGFAVSAMLYLLLPVEYIYWAWIVAAIVIFAALMSFFPESDGNSMGRAKRIFGIVFTFHVVCFGWIYFRARDMATAKSVLSQIFTDFKASLIPDVVSGYAVIFGLMALGYALHFVSTRTENAFVQKVVKMPLWGFAVILTALIWLVMQIKSSGIQPFIYFQF